MQKPLKRRGKTTGCIPKLFHYQRRNDATGKVRVYSQTLYNK
jgi:hypothetical protein